SGPRGAGCIRSCRGSASGDVMVLEARAESRLLELPGRCTWDRVDELEHIRQPESRKVRLEKRTQIFGGGCGAWLQDYRRQGTLNPPRGRDRNDCGFSNRRMPHQCGLERDRADPLAAGLDQILVTVLNAHRRPFVDGDDVAGSEPTIFGKTIAAVVA